MCEFLHQNGGGFFGKTRRLNKKFRLTLRAKFLFFPENEKGGEKARNVRRGAKHGKEASKKLRTTIYSSRCRLLFRGAKLRDVVLMWECCVSTSIPNNCRLRLPRFLWLAKNATAFYYFRPPSMFDLFFPTRVVRVCVVDLRRRMMAWPLLWMMMMVGRSLGPRVRRLTYERDKTLLSSHFKKRRGKKYDLTSEKGNFFWLIARCDAF